ncbi:MAG: hypothetical protein U0R64_01545 [Candidatus Nanopelagicales bacterium]
MADPPSVGGCHERVACPEPAVAVGPAGAAGVVAPADTSTTVAAAEPDPATSVAVTVITFDPGLSYWWVPVQVPAST